MLRLPYLQVTQETWGKARMLGGLLGMSRREAFGLICDFWAWAVEIGPPDQPPSGACENRKALLMMAGALEFPTDRAVELAEALEAVGLLERRPGGGIRAKGMDRYRRTWLKNHGGKRAGKVPETGANPAPISAGTGAQDQDVDVDQEVDSKTKHVGGNPPTPTAHEQLQAAWNELTPEPIPRWRETGKVRKKLAQEALKRRPLAEWREVFRKIGSSPFCRGETNGWRADPDWALRAEGRKPETAAKVLDGAYDAASPKPSANRSVGSHANVDGDCEVCGHQAYGLVWGHRLCARCVGTWDGSSPPRDVEDLTAWTAKWVADRRAEFPDFPDGSLIAGAG